MVGALALNVLFYLYSGSIPYFNTWNYRTVVTMLIWMGVSAANPVVYLTMNRCVYLYLFEIWMEYMFNTQEIYCAILCSTIRRNIAKMLGDFFAKIKMNCSSVATSRSKKQSSSKKISPKNKF